MKIGFRCKFSIEPEGVHSILAGMAIMPKRIVNQQQSADFKAEIEEIDHHRGDSELGSEKNSPDG